MALTPERATKRKPQTIDRRTHVATGEVTTLEHELGDDTVEGGALVAEAGGTSAELLEVLGGLGDNVVVQGEVDTASLDCKVRIDVSSLS